MPIFPSALADVEKIQADIGNPSARSNQASLELMIGVPDAASSSLYDLMADKTTLDALVTTVGVAGAGLSAIPDMASDTSLDALITTVGVAGAGLSAIPDMADKTTLDALVTTVGVAGAGLSAIPDMASDTSLDALITTVGVAGAGLSAIPDMATATAQADQALEASLQGLITTVGVAGAGLSAIPDMADKTTLDALVTTVGVAGAGLSAIPDMASDTSLDALITTVGVAGAGLTAIPGLVTDDSSGTFSLVNNTNEQDVVVLTTSTRKIIQGMWLDLFNIANDGIIKVYYKIDGTNYREIDSEAFIASGTKDGVYFDLNPGITNAFKITYKASVAEGSAKDIPYSIIYSIVE